MYFSVKWTKYEWPLCWCGKEKKLIKKYCNSCSNKLNLLRSKYNWARNPEYKEIHKKELESFIKINNL